MVQEAVVVAVAVAAAGGSRCSIAYGKVRAEDLFGAEAGTVASQHATKGQCVVAATFAYDNDEDRGGVEGGGNTGRTVEAAMA